jgi:hypothetical protein
MPVTLTSSERAYFKWDSYRTETQACPVVKYEACTFEGDGCEVVSGLEYNNPFNEYAVSGETN